ncbi:soluble starch synthase 1, chloroplastic/amyloplastic-like isoform X2 [Cajanus cajan]|uniref:soluble starch synthase 1, chloroplastic/amyloplastic-like isoform X2 n=1 Tax=Cajanus cajan TaxID=3821 RepID=UPI00098DA493|nr:soluble starch synthase 1, chloroplastic/amyloplastic-like isoform X2 [Cajanus cajan]
MGWVFPTWARTHALDTGEAVNFLKGAIVTADRIVTGYSWEITTSEGGCSLHELLSSRKSVLNGITNGIDVTEWDPSCDKHIACNYSADDLSGKAECKISLQEELGLPVRLDCPLVSLLSARQNSCSLRSLFLLLTIAKSCRLDSLGDWTTERH